MSPVYFNSLAFLSRSLTFFAFLFLPAPGTISFYIVTMLNGLSNHLCDVALQSTIQKNLNTEAKGSVMSVNTAIGSLSFVIMPGLAHGIISFSNVYGPFVMIGILDAVYSGLCLMLIKS